jgi:uncharacterized RDD family membrane protein YckC
LGRPDVSTTALLKAMPAEIDTQILIGVLVIPAITFALLYVPIVTYFSRGLVSAYAKADIRKRIAAAAIDGLLVVTASVFSWTAGSVTYIVSGAIYLLLRDAIGGQSIGKLLLGLMVISLDTGRPTSVAGALKRNLVLLLPGANVVAIFLEARTVVRDPQGQRLGDRLAQTQVVEGLGAKEFVKSFQKLLMTLSHELDREVGGRRRLPGEIDRAA